MVFADRARAVARSVKMGRPPKLTPHQRKEAIKRRDEGNETLADIGRSYNVSAANDFAIDGMTRHKDGVGEKPEG